MVLCHVHCGAGIEPRESLQTGGEVVDLHPFPVSAEAFRTAVAASVRTFRPAPSEKFEFWADPFQRWVAFTDLSTFLQSCSQPFYLRFAPSAPKPPAKQPAAPVVAANPPAKPAAAQQPPATAKPPAASTVAVAAKPAPAGATATAAQAAKPAAAEQPAAKPKPAAAPTAATPAAKPKPAAAQAVVAKPAAAPPAAEPAAPSAAVAAKPAATQAEQPAAKPKPAAAATPQAVVAKPAAAPPAASHAAKPKPAAEQPAAKPAAPSAAVAAKVAAAPPPAAKPKPAPPAAVAQPTAQVAKPAAAPPQAAAKPKPPAKPAAATPQPATAQAVAKPAAPTVSTLHCGHCGLPLVACVPAAARSCSMCLLNTTGGTQLQQCGRCHWVLCSPCVSRRRALIANRGTIPCGNCRSPTVLSDAAGGVCNACNGPRGIATQRCTSCAWALCTNCVSGRAQQPPAPAPGAPAPAPERSAHSGSECVICLEGSATMAAVPCGHRVFCRDCAHLTRTCPVCRQPMSSVLRIFT